jgi:flavin-binding protein dodecin
LRVAEISKPDLKVDSGKVVEYRARVSLSFKYEA